MRVVICHKMRWILSMIKYLPDIYLLKKIGIFACSNNSNNNSCNPIVPCGVCSIDDGNWQVNYLEYFINGNETYNKSETKLCCDTFQVYYILAFANVALFKKTRMDFSVNKFQKIPDISE